MLGVAGDGAPVRWPAAAVGVPVPAIGAAGVEQLAGTMGRNRFVVAVHECPECGQACDCDGEDHDQGAPDDCSHACDEDDDFYGCEGGD